MNVGRITPLRASSKPHKKWRVEVEIEAPQFDYRGLLIKYIERISDCEGATYIGPISHSEVQFSEMETVELERLEKIAVENGNRRWQEKQRKWRREQNERA